MIREKTFFPSAADFLFPAHMNDDRFVFVDRVKRTSIKSWLTWKLMIIFLILKMLWMRRWRKCWMDQLLKNVPKRVQCMASGRDLIQSKN